MDNIRLEQGLLKIFRIFLLLQLVLIYVHVFVPSARGYLLSCPGCALAFGTGSIFMLLAYLSIPWLQDKLGRYYLPIALVLAAIVSLVVQDFFLYIQTPFSGGSSEETAWQLFLFLFIPLVLIGWQYDFKAVVAYCIFTALLDHTLMNYGRDDFYLIQADYRRLIFIRTLTFLIVGYIITRIVTQMRQQQVALQEANRKLAHYAATMEQLSVSRERNRMARELHDTLAHTLSGLAVQLEGVKSLWKSDPEKSYGMLEQSLDATRSGLIETRKAIHSLRATPLEDLGIGLAIRELAETAAERAGFDLELDLSGATGDRLARDWEQCIYRVAQEALENIVKHAAAQQVELKLTRRNGLVQLIVCDDGVGFDRADVDQGQHYGLQGICERSELVGGRVEIDSEPGKGTIVRLKLGNPEKDQS
jgi:signal transduction histidine kinase